MPPEPAPVRVVHVRNSDRVSGPERLLIDQARHASPAIEVHVAVFAPPGRPSAFLDMAEREGVRVLRIEQRSSYDPRLVGRLHERLTAVGADLVVTHDYKANFVGRRAARLGAIPWIAVAHGYTAEDLKVRVFEALDRRALRRADAVVVVSEALRERLRRGGVPEDRLHGVDNGIDVARVIEAAEASRDRARAALGASEGDALVVALGRTSPEKGQDLLLEAFARLAESRPALRLALVGDGPLLEGLARRADAAGLRERVALPGWRDDGPACLAVADVVVMPSRSEGLPIALLEALAVGTPVVVTDVGAMADVVEGGSAGLVVPPNDVAALADAIAATLDFPGAARARAALGRRRVETRYGTRAQAARLEALYLSVVARSRRRYPFR